MQWKLTSGQSDQILLKEIIIKLKSSEQNKVKISFKSNNDMLNIKKCNWITLKKYIHEDVCLEKWHLENISIISIIDNVIELKYSDAIYSNNDEKMVYKLFSQISP